MHICVIDVACLYNETRKIGNNSFRIVKFSYQASSFVDSIYLSHLREKEKERSITPMLNYNFYQIFFP